MKKWLFILLFLVLSGCGLDPRRAAEADRIRSQTRIEEQAAAQSLADEAADLAEENAIRPYRVVFWQDVLWFARYPAFLLLAGVGLGGGAAAAGWGIAAARRRWKTAAFAVVALDEKTGQFPAIVLSDRLLEPNAAYVLPFGEPAEADRILSAGATYIRALGVNGERAARNGNAQTLQPHLLNVDADFTK